MASRIAIVATVCLLQPLLSHGAPFFPGFNEMMQGIGNMNMAVSGNKNGGDFVQMGLPGLGGGMTVKSSGKGKKAEDFVQMGIPGLGGMTVKSGPDGDTVHFGGFGGFGGFGAPANNPVYNYGYGPYGQSTTVITSPPTIPAPSIVPPTIPAPSIVPVIQPVAPSVPAPVMPVVPPVMPSVPAPIPPPVFVPSVNAAPSTFVISNMQINGRTYQTRSDGFLYIDNRKTNVKTGGNLSFSMQNNQVTINGVPESQIQFV